MNLNLTTLTIRNEEGPGPYNKPLEDYSMDYTTADIAVIFRNHKDILIKKISQYSVIVGCVAWLTDFDIIAALAHKDNVIIVVQKEDFLRPDLGASDDWKIKLRRAYSSIKKDYARWFWPGLISDLSICGDDGEAIRCVGNYNRDKKSAFPRMHNKFIVFGDVDKLENDELGWSFKEVWTGSFNFTVNANMSFENAVLIKNEAIANAYYNEFCQIYALSESLDWTSDWCEPEYRIGT